MSQIVPIRDPRNTNEISQLCHAKDEPIFVTKNGYGDLVVKTYELLTKTSDINDTVSSHKNKIDKIDNEEALFDDKDA